MSLSILDHQLLEAVLAIDMEALEQFGVFEGIKADCTGQLVLQLLEGLLGYSLGFSHYLNQVNHSLVVLQCVTNINLIRKVLLHFKG